MQNATMRAKRLQQVEWLLLSHPEGLSRAEIARRMNVHRATAGRDIDALSQDSAIYEREDRRIAIHRDNFLNLIRLTRHEVVALHLATRLLADHSDRSYPEAASAVRKLGEAVRSVAPRIADIIEANADLLDDANTRRDPEFLRVLGRLTAAWGDGRQVELRYRSARSGAERHYRMNIYQIRAYAPGRTFHVIGHCEADRGLRTLRLDRIRAATVTDVSYSVPEGLNIQSLLDGAWNVWYGDAATEIVLRFSPNVAGRVQESRWHSGESSRLMDDGRLEWRTTVAEPREMYPWIRGWGADVEIVEPASLREEFSGELRAMCVIYGLNGIDPGNGPGGRSEEKM